MWTLYDMFSESRGYEGYEGYGSYQAYGGYEGYGGYQAYGDQQRDYYRKGEYNFYWLWYWLIFLLILFERLWRQPRLLEERLLQRLL